MSSFSQLLTNFSWGADSYREQQAETHMSLGVHLQLIKAVVALRLNIPNWTGNLVSWLMSARVQLADEERRMRRWRRRRSLPTSEWVRAHADCYITSNRGGGHFSLLTLLPSNPSPSHSFKSKSCHIHAFINQMSQGSLTFKQTPNSADSDLKGRCMFFVFL